MSSNDRGASFRFETRELKPYSQPVQASVLQEGNIYFCLQFFDDEMLIPEMRPLIFIGHNLSPGDLNQSYFQDVASYREGVRWDSNVKSNEATFESFPAKNNCIGAIYEYEHALEDLMRCSLMRKRASAHNPR